MHKSIRQFISYFFVGGAAALVEWLMFWIFVHLLGLQYLLATCMAFLFSTTANFILGRNFTFKEVKCQANFFSGLIGVFSVSILGLALNILIMFLFVTCLKMEHGSQLMVSKIFATGVVFMWNFLSRKFIVYKHRS